MKPDQRQLFVNGKLVDQVAVSGEVPVGPQPISIGGRADNSEWYQGSIDHVAIYDVLLPEATVAKHYRALAGKLDHLKIAKTKEQYIWAAYCQALFAMNEFIYVE